MTAWRALLSVSRSARASAREFIRRQLNELRAELHVLQYQAAAQRERRPEG